MIYDAITLDTNIFRKNSYNLESGLLGKLKQFKEGSVQLILSEIVVRELKQHLIRDSLDIKSKLDMSLKDISKSYLLQENTLKTIHSLISSEVDAETAAKNRLRKFIDETGAIIIEAKHTSIKEVIKIYFDTVAPFEKTGSKKNEFPDAIALLSMTNWTKKYNKKILAISEDKGWLEYAKDKEWMDVETDLTNALVLIQKNTEQVSTIAECFLKRLFAGEYPKIQERIDKDVCDAVSSLDVYAEANSWLHHEAEFVSIEFIEFSYKNDADFSILQIGRNFIVLEVPVLIKASASTTFYFYVWDSIDKEEIPMGSSPAATDVEFDAAILITVNIDSLTTPNEIDVLEIELIKTINSIDFDEVEPDFRDDYYEG